MKVRIKHKLYGALFSVGMAFLLGGCGKTVLSAAGEDTQVQESPQIIEGTLLENDIGKTEAEIPRQNVQEQEHREIEDVGEAYETILELCTGEFIGHHLVDENFLAWFSARYGTDGVVDIAEQVASGNMDKNIWYELTGNSIHVLWLQYCEQTGFQEYQLERVDWKETAVDTEATLVFTGDINFAERYVTTKHMDASAGGIYDCFSEDLLQLMNEADVMMVNNEFTYSKRGTPLPGKAFTFRADPSRVELLKVFGTDIVNVANNHVYDYGPEALLDTLDTLRQAEIPYVGAGTNLEEASRPYYFVLNGRKIAIVSASQIERTLNYTKEATEHTPGVLKTLKPDKFVKVIKDAKKNSDYVIAVVHWGTEGDSKYGRDQYHLARTFVTAGADAVVGGHTHCLQGFEMIDGVPIIYSLGNFWFSSSTQDTGLAKITIDQSGELTMSFIPCIQENTRTRLITEESEKKRILDFMQSHSAAGVTVSEEGVVK